MNRLLVILAFLTLCSCSPHLGRVIRSTDKFKNEKNVRLDQSLRAYRADDNRIFNRHRVANIRLNHFARIFGNGSNLLTLDIVHNHKVSVYSHDSTLYMQVDASIFKLEPTKHVTKQYTSSRTSTTTETKVEEKSSDSKTDSGKKDNVVTTTNTTSVDQGTYEMIMFSYTVPNEMAHAIANSSKLTYRVYLGNRPIDIKPSASERRMIRKFFRSSLRN